MNSLLEKKKKKKPLNKLAYFLLASKFENLEHSISFLIFGSEIFVRFFATRKIIDAIDYLKSIAPTIVKYTC
jgi:hypothetical protein